ncbi:phage tail protein [Streptomyces mirabilis]|uniref:phage tail protein n=1 Tax=Streptomyces mirabilis TaxID=68239 RepID=UPI0035D97584
MRRLTGTLGGLRGSLGTVRTSAGGGDGAGGGLDKLRGAVISLAPALIPVAASLVPIVVNAAAAGTAVGAFGLAVAGQVVAMNAAADAQKKYDDAVKKHGPASAQAAQAESLFLDQVQGMDPATRRAAASLEVLKDSYRQWSKGLAGDTMPVVTKGLAAFGALLPKLTPMVKGASGQLDRFVTILGGGVNSAGFSKFMASFASFSTGALKSANDGLIHLMRTMSSGAGANSGKFTEFMAYVKQVGPQVGDTLMNLSRALTHLVVAASDTGVSMLGIVNGLAKIVNAVPTSVLSTLLQFSIALKAVKLAGAGMSALGGLSGVATAIGGMRTAAAGASGPLASLSAAFGTLSRSAKLAVVGTGIGILVIALMRLSSMGKSAPPDVDKLTTSLGNLAQSGKVGGEAARVFGKDFGQLGDALRTLSRPSNLDKTQQFLTSLVGMDSTPVKDAKEAFGGLDKALAGMVKGGKAGEAKIALEDTIKGLKKQGFTSKEVTSQLDAYKSALADQALEQKLAAQSMGLFGDQALAVQAKLDAQKQSADGLRGAIQALNNVNRQGLGGMIGFEAAVDAAAKAAKDNAGALSMTNGVLNLGSEKARNAATALQDLADKTDSAAASARESGSSWETVNGIYARGRSELIKSARAMGLTKAEAGQLADKILSIPDKKSTKLEMRTEDATAGLDSVLSALKKTPNAKHVTVSALTDDAVSMLRELGLKVTRLKDGRFQITANGKPAKSAIDAVQRARDGLKDKTITLSARDRASAAAHAIQAAINALRSKTVTITTVREVKAVYSTVGRPTSGEGGVSKNATGGRVRGYASGGDVQMFPNGGYVDGPGGPTSDSVLALMGSGAAARVSDTEYVVQSSAVKKYGVGLLDALNAGRLKLAGFAKGGLTAAEKSARSALSGQFGISHFGRMAGYHTTPFERSLGSPADLGSLTQALNEAASQIRAAFHGRTEARLEKELDSVGKSLIRYDKQLYNVTRSLDGAKTKLDGLKNSASQLSDSVKGNVLSSSSITQGVSAGGTVTVASLMGGLTQSRDKASAFADALKGLKGKGLSKDLLQQIAEAGVNGGGLETAGALLGASKSEISSINSLQGQIAKAAGSAGKTTADAVYGSAIKAQEKLVASLTRQQDKLEKAMSNLAKVMERALAKAVKGKASGGIVGAAASGGVRGGLTWVGEHEPELLDLPVGSRVWSGPDSRRMAGGGGGGPAHAVLEIRSGGSETDEFILQLIRRAVRVRGGNVQLVLAGRPV